MASQVSNTDINGGASNSKSLAAMLEEQHARNEAHKATVEETVDEEDLLHPPPSASAKDQEPAVPETTAAVDEAAAATSSAPKPAPKKAPAFDVRSEELFPALGSGPKPKTPAAATWGARPSAAAAVANGVAGGSPATAGDVPRIMSLPGKHMEQLRLAPSQMLPRGQLKKPLRDILRDISRRSKANVDMRGGPGGSIIFEGKGSVESVRQALKEVAQQVGSKQSVRVPIPTSARAHIIGRQGAIVQDIQQRTGARVQVPRAEGSADEDDNDTIDVLIEGDAVAAELARRQIEAIVKERASNMSLRLKTIPAEFFPFIAGVHNENLKAIEERTKAQVHVPRYDTWESQPPPQEAEPGHVQFAPASDKHIHISGERTAAQEARAEIERLAADLQRQLTLRQLAINRGQHQFILGEGANALHEFLADTGCAIVLPPASDDSEFLTITGPSNCIEAGINRAMDLATSMQMASIDLSRQHPNAPAGPHAHARALTRYLRERQIIQQLEQMYDARIALPPKSDGPVTWEVYSRDGKNTIRARSDIMNLVQAHPPARVRYVSVDPYYHPYLESRSLNKLRNDYGVHLLIPDEADSSDVVLVYEGPSASTSQPEIPRQRPSPAEIAAFEKSLQEAQEFLVQLTGDQNDIVAKSVDVPAKYQDKVRKYISREQQTEGEVQIPIRSLVGDARNDGKCEVSLRGPSGQVDGLVSKIHAFVAEQEKDDLERGYTISFDFPQKFANFLIGKRGENINKLRDEFDVDIKVDNGKVEVKGPKAKADAAKMRIINLGKKLEDETTHVLKIPAQYHRELIGQKGSQVNRLQDRYSVRVQFPRAAAATGDDQSVADTSSEVGGARPIRPQQASDEVIVKGPSKGADSARDEILSLLQWVVDHSHSATVSVAQSQIPSLIGQRGREMDKLRADTGAQIDVPGANDAPDDSGRVQIKIKGTKQQVEEAKKILQQRSSEFDAIVTKTIDVDKKYHKALIGGGGANIRKIVAEAGGPTDGGASRIVRFPRPESTESTIKLEGNGKVVENIIAAIEAFVKEREDQVSITVEVPPVQHRLLIGRGGETRRGIESQFNVTMDIPKQGSGRSDIKLKGPSDAVEGAKEHILSLLKDQQGETVEVPRHLHHAVSDNGAFFRRLRNDYRVTVDHAGQEVPAKPASEESRATTSGASSLPLITDEPSDSIETHSWKTVEHGAAASDPTRPATIPWVLIGSGDNVARAKSALEKAISAASQQSATGYLILPDPKTYRFVVGQGGSQINAIRKQTGCRINVPKDQARGEAIEIKGSPEGLEKAKEMILEAVRAGLSGAPR
ncbi:putative RNA binding effector protein Scp160 [Aspergillus clavatus NRRL 1]|uniref:RNA binding effector protein Scp160, putative n=1 Tax=Aspergillus clavatus (strain ATCC 1007 / CBS 513.65 / DSM 816 / NCTC 3887 / NRRL 1 / QM 1276 / 107) TaxID=344612 RepID=A1CEK4_ASPCL|nr:RNA binding effector protein Scp160, putative [Aspergillus clavatus NRRL 1]EAW11303.1 RNA binding effector protein Scp160, putative [Aspergillus clavatus NRRL 1]